MRSGSDMVDRVKGMVDGVKGWGGQGNRVNARCRLRQRRPYPLHRTHPGSAGCKARHKRAARTNASVFSGFLALLPPCEKIRARPPPGTLPRGTPDGWRRRPRPERGRSITHPPGQAGAARQRRFFHTEEARRGSRRTRRAGLSAWSATRTETGVGRRSGRGIELI